MSGTVTTNSPTVQTRECNGKEMPHCNLAAQECFIKQRPAEFLFFFFYNLSLLLCSVSPSLTKVNLSSSLSVKICVHHPVTLCSISLCTPANTVSHTHARTPHRAACGPWSPPSSHFWPVLLCVSSCETRAVYLGCKWLWIGASARWLCT